MNKILLLAVFMFLSGAALAQGKSVQIHVTEDTTTKANVKKVMPEFKGDLGTYLMKNVKLSHKPSGDEEIRFLVGADGDLSQFRIIKSAGADVDTAFVRALRVMPKWQPGTEDSVAVAMWYNLPIDLN